MTIGSCAFSFWVAIATEYPKCNDGVQRDEFAVVGPAFRDKTHFFLRASIVSTHGLRASKPADYGHG